ncbi:MAG: hypothetical protein C0601_09215 [Candidatus Muiribacterium halophilum]|uniref:Glycosyltransferase 2-like domain-containing protein n=1 Tax=Muiribacterium halophilum TaxID=2053465 RepID=A0A2N5ZDR9_MUIH1|nr:MAG: hypothetical protein C0601_09215 [Candidatus Muirbacterium halophilum]
MEKMFEDSVSVIIPVFNEKDNIKRLIEETLFVLKAFKCFEIIVVDDGSTEDIFSEIESFNNIKYIRLLNNLGQGLAIRVGLLFAKNKYIVTMDGDGQNDPKDIIRLYESIIKNDADLICGLRKNRKDKHIKRILSLGAYYLRHVFLKDETRDSGCTLKIYKKDVFININMDGRAFMFLPFFFKCLGYKVAQKEVVHRRRFSGKSKYISFFEVLVGLRYLLFFFIYKMLFPVRFKSFLKQNIINKDNVNDYIQDIREN